MGKSKKQRREDPSDFGASSFWGSGTHDLGLAGGLGLSGYQEKP